MFNLYIEIYLYQNLTHLTKIAADDSLYIFYFYLSKKIRLGVSCESSARQRIHMNNKSYFSEKQWKSINEFMNVVCCSRDWSLKGKHFMCKGKHFLISSWLDGLLWRKHKFCIYNVPYIFVGCSVLFAGFLFFYSLLAISRTLMSRRTLLH